MLTRAWLFETAPASSRTSRSVYLKEVKQCEIFIAIVLEGLPTGVREELHLASQLGKRRLIFLSSSAPASTRKFLERLPDAPKYRLFHSQSELLAQIGEGIYSEFVDVYRETLGKSLTGPAVFVPPRSGQLIGRAKDLSRLANMLERSGGRPVLIVGPVAVGKSALAREFAHREVARRKVVWWIDARDDAEIANGLEALAVALKVVLPGESDQQSVLRSLEDWLAVAPDWLLVFDDCPDPARVREFLPSAHRGQVLITSQVPFGSVRNILRINGLSQRQRRQPPIRPSADILKRRSPEAIELISTLAFLAPDNIPIHELSAPKRILPAKMRRSLDSQNLAFAIEELVKSGLVEYDTAIWIQPATQTLVRQAMSAERARDVAHAATVLVEAAFPWDPLEPPSWPKAERLYPHARAVLQYGDPLKIKTWASIQLWLKRSAFNSRRRLDLASQELDRALEAAITKFGTAHAVYADVMNSTALLHHTLSDLSGASRASAEAMRVIATGGRAGRVFSVFNTAGMIAKHTGDFERARQLLGLTLELERANLGPSPVVLANLAGVYLELGDPKGARSLLDEAESLTASGSRRPIVINNAANWHTRFGDPQEAVSLHRALLADRLSLYGSNSPTVAISLNGLACALQGLGEHAAAISMFESAIKIEESSFGPLHLRTAICFRNLALSQQQAGSSALAKESGERAQRLLVSILGRSKASSLCLYW
jgi:tetratricopeptide (TPR) repeat protein